MVLTPVYRGPLHPYLDHGEPENEPIEKVYVTTLVTPMGLFNYVDGINSKITPKK